MPDNQDADIINAAKNVAKFKQFRWIGFLVSRAKVFNFTVLAFAWAMSFVIPPPTAWLVSAGFSAAFLLFITEDAIKTWWSKIEEVEYIRLKKEDETKRRITRDQKIERFVRKYWQRAYNVNQGNPDGSEQTFRSEIAQLFD